jgi:hypothetical protein
MENSESKDNLIPPLLPKLSLWEIEKNMEKTFAKLFRLTENPEDFEPEDIEELEKELSLNDENHKTKVRNFLMLIRNLEGENLANKMELERFKKRIEKNDKVIKKLTDRLENNLNALNINEIQVESFNLRLKESVSTDVKGFEKFVTPFVEKLNIKEKLLESVSIPENNYPIDNLSEFFEIEIEIKPKALVIKKLLKQIDKDTEKKIKEAKETGATLILKNTDLFNCQLVTNKKLVIE